MNGEISYANLQVNVSFHPAYLQRIQQSVFLDRSIENDVRDNNMAFTLLAPLQKERYKWHSSGSDTEYFLDYNDFFRVVLCLTLRKKRDMDAIEEALKRIMDTQKVLQSYIRYKDGFMVKFVPIEQEELDKTREAIRKYSNNDDSKFLTYSELYIC